MDNKINFEFVLVTINGYKKPDITILKGIYFLTQKKGVFSKF